MDREYSVNIVIPTYNRSRLLRSAVEAALEQSYAGTYVTVVDDGSQDNTWDVCSEYQAHANFSAIRLSRNVGTAQAKNAALVFNSCDAITFHDSDDIPARDKINLTVRPLVSIKPRASCELNWKTLNRVVGEFLDIDVVVGSYSLVKMDGREHYIDNKISLVDDFFPNLQFPTKTQGDWCLINAGLFRSSVFERLGGFKNVIEEDRDLRNRCLTSGQIFYFVDRPLLTKFEEFDSLTVAEDTTFCSAQRTLDREKIISKCGREMLNNGGESISVNLENVSPERIINPQNLSLSNVPMTTQTRIKWEYAINSAKSPRYSRPAAVSRMDVALEQPASMI